MEPAQRIKIHYIDSRIFAVGETKYSMREGMIRNFAQIDSLIEKKLRIGEKEGKTYELAIYRVTNLPCGKPVQCVTGELALFFSYCFFESVGDELPVPFNLNDPIKKTSEQWYNQVREFSPNYHIMDPDGWDRTNYDFSFKEELITYDEFVKRSMYSTATYHKDQKPPMSFKDDGNGNLIVF